MINFLVYSLILCSLGAFLNGYGMLFKELRVSVTNATITSLSLRNLSLNVTLLVENPNPVGLKLRAIVFNIYYKQENQWIFLSHGKQAGIALRPGSNEMSIPIIVKNAGLVGVLSDMIKTDSFTLQIKGTAAPDFLVVAPEIPF